MPIEMSGLNFYLDSFVTDPRSGSLSINVSVWSIVSSYSKCSIYLESLEIPYLNSTLFCLSPVYAFNRIIALLDRDPWPLVSTTSVDFDFFFNNLLLSHYHHLKMYSRAFMFKHSICYPVF